jgi:hypothetical protein
VLETGNDCYCEAIDFGDGESNPQAAHCMAACETKNYCQ